MAVVLGKHLYLPAIYYNLVVSHYFQGGLAGSLEASWNEALVLASLQALSTLHLSSNVI
jgi:hypothetical protein